MNYKMPEHAENDCDNKGHREYFSQRNSHRSNLTEKTFFDFFI